MEDKLSSLTEVLKSKRNGQMLFAILQTEKIQENESLRKIEK